MPITHTRTQITHAKYPQLIGKKLFLTLTLISTVMMRRIQKDDQEYPAMVTSIDRSVEVKEQ